VLAMRRLLVTAIAIVYAKRRAKKRKRKN